MIEEACDEGLSLMKTEYPREFYEYLGLRYTLLDGEARFARRGLLIPTMRCRGKRLPPGLLEDFLLYICNNHPHLNCIFAVPGGHISSLENTQVFILHYCLAFAITSLAHPIFGAMGFSDQASPRVTEAFSILCVNPICTGISNAGKMLLSTCKKSAPALGAKYKSAFILFNLASRLSMLAFVAFIFFLLVFASLFSDKPDTRSLILLFFKDIILPPFFLHLIFAMLAFFPYYHIDVSFFGPLKWPRFTIGKRYCEMLRHNRKVEGVDFLVSSWNLAYIIRIDYIRDVTEMDINTGWRGVDESKAGSGCGWEIGMPRQKNTRETLYTRRRRMMKLPSKGQESNALNSMVPSRKLHISNPMTSISPLSPVASSLWQSHQSSTSYNTQYHTSSTGMYMSDEAEDREMKMPMNIWPVPPLPSPPPLPRQDPTPTQALPPPRPAHKRSSVRDVLQSTKSNPLADRRKSIAKRREGKRESYIMPSSEGSREAAADGDTNEGNGEVTNEVAEQHEQSLDSLQTYPSYPPTHRPSKAIHTNHNEIESRVAFYEQYLSGAAVDERDSIQVRIGLRFSFSFLLYDIFMSFVVSVILL